MLTLVTSALWCESTTSDGKKFYQRGSIQNIATAIDIIVGFGLIAAGFSMNCPIMAVVGAIQIWPFLALITLVFLSCKNKAWKDNIDVRFRPCLSQNGCLNRA